MQVDGSRSQLQFPTLLGSAQPTEKRNTNGTDGNSDGIWTEFRQNEKRKKRNFHISENTQIPSVFSVCHGTWEGTEVRQRGTGAGPRYDPGVPEAELSGNFGKKHFHAARGCCH